MELALTFDDVTLVPVHSKIRSRKEPRPNTKLGDLSLYVPIIAAPMNTVSESEMCKAMLNVGGSAVLHRYLSISEQVEQINDLVAVYNCSHPLIFAAIGATGDYLERAQELYKHGCRKFCIDVANGHSEVCIEAARTIAHNFADDIDLMAGNVCTGDGASRLADAGANVIRVGIGGGSVCSTRIVSGFGVPQFTAIEDTVDAVGGIAHVVADGGIRNSGDIVKALAIGADAVMIGGLLAGTSQAPGEIRRDSDGRLYKMFNGMASEEGRKTWFSRDSSMFVPEGVSSKVPFKGDVTKIIEELVGGLRVGMSFAGASTLSELRKNAVWSRVTVNGRREANPNKRLHNA